MCEMRMDGSLEKEGREGRREGGKERGREEVRLGGRKGGLKRGEIVSPDDDAALVFFLHWLSLP